VLDFANFKTSALKYIQLYKVCQISQISKHLHWNIYNFTNFVKNLLDFANFKTSALKYIRQLYKVCKSLSDFANFKISTLEYIQLYKVRNSLSDIANFKISTRTFIFLLQPTNAHLGRRPAMHFYSLHRDVPVTPVTIFKVSYSANTSSMLVITQECVRKPSEILVNWFQRLPYYKSIIKSFNTVK
jgi:hypothetical protein